MRAFLIFDNQNHAQRALTIVNDNYGCPITHENGYQMTEWAYCTNSETNKKLWGFYKPANEECMDGIDFDYTEEKKIPEDWYINEV